MWWIVVRSLVLSLVNIEAVDFYRKESAALKVSGRLFKRESPAALVVSGRLFGRVSAVALVSSGQLFERELTAALKWSALRQRGVTAISSLA
jgi:hypothetical protein